MIFFNFRLAEASESKFVIAPVTCSTAAAESPSRLSSVLAAETAATAAATATASNASSPAFDAAMLCSAAASNSALSITPSLFVSIASKSVEPLPTGDL